MNINSEIKCSSKINNIIIGKFNLLSRQIQIYRILRITVKKIVMATYIQGVFKTPRTLLHFTLTPNFRARIFINWIKHIIFAILTSQLCIFPGLKAKNLKLSKWAPPKKAP